MMKITKFIALIASVFAIASASASAQEVFLCMQNEQNTALSIDENGVLEYIDMTDSNGVKVIPQVSGDGNTYLPFRFVCEMAGFADAAKGNTTDNYFRFVDRDTNIADSRQRIEICRNGEIISHEIGVEFSYEAYPGDVRNVCIYNIEGSLYFPMTYMTKITDARTFWCDETGDIIFATSGVDTSKYIDNNAKILDSAMNKAAYYPIFDENKEDSKYIASDGTSTHLGESVANVYRIKNTLYFIQHSGKIMTKDELTGEVTELKFKDDGGTRQTIYAEEFLIIKNRLYGVDASNFKLFICNTDGSDFKYITDKGVYSLFLRKYNRNYYLYYCDKQSKSEVHMIELTTMDDYTIEITDMEHNNLLSDIKSFSVTDSQFVYTDQGLRVHTINLDDPLEEFEIARVREGQYHISEVGI